MKITVLPVLLLAFMIGCGSTPVGPAPVNPAPEPIYDNVVACTHKYSSKYDFVYGGQIKSYQQNMFGEKVFVYEYTLLDGKRMYLSGKDVVNFVCVKQVR